ncbi:hypothetical protein ACJX0J_040600, partial [Zea mays]
FEYAYALKMSNDVWVEINSDSLCIFVDIYVSKHIFLSHITGRLKRNHKDNEVGNHGGDTTYQWIGAEMKKNVLLGSVPAPINLIHSVAKLFMEVEASMAISFTLLKLLTLELDALAYMLRRFGQASVDFQYMMDKTTQRLLIRYNPNISPIVIGQLNLIGFGRLTSKGRGTQQVAERDPVVSCIGTRKMIEISTGELDNFIFSQPMFDIDVLEFNQSTNDFRLKG